MGTGPAGEDQGADLVALGHVMGQRAASLVEGVGGVGGDDEQANRF